MGKYFCDAFPVHKGVKQGDALSPVSVNFTLEYTKSKIHQNKVGLKFNETRQLLVCADDVSLLS
jgi:hypothetical protein